MDKLLNNNTHIQSKYHSVYWGKRNLNNMIKGKLHLSFRTQIKYFILFVWHPLVVKWNGLQPVSSFILLLFQHLSLQRFFSTFSWYFLNLCSIFFLFCSKNYIVAAEKILMQYVKKFTCPLFSVCRGVQPRWRWRGHRAQSGSPQNRWTALQTSGGLPRHLTLQNTRSGK